MILRDKPGFVQLAFALRGSIVPAIAPQVLGLAGFAALIVWAHNRLAGFPNIDATPFTVFGIALSLFLGFRNNAAYERWWEARKLWGGLLADMRSFAREAELFISRKEDRIRALRLAIAFMHLHRARLRRLPDDATARAAAGRVGLPTDGPLPRPCAPLDAIAALLGKARQDGTLDGYGARALGERLASITLAQAGAERIATTPLPYVYSLLVYRTTYLYCLLLPLALAEPAGWLAPFFVAIVAYVFLGLAEVTEDLSHPFGNTVNALPLNALCRTAEISLAPHLGEEPPVPLAPVDYYLS
jgi:putative membrane protein